MRTLIHSLRDSRCNGWLSSQKRFLWIERKYAEVGDWMGLPFEDQRPCHDHDLKSLDSLV